MKTREFLLYTLAVMIGTTIALAIAGIYLKSQLTAATSGNSTIGTLLSLFGRRDAGGDHVLLIMPFECCQFDSAQRPILIAQSSDGRHFELVTSFDYIASDGRHFRAPIGGKSDGASTPPELWSLMGEQWLTPFGTYWPAVYIHDGAYQNWLQLVDTNGNVSPANLTKDQADELCKEIMEELCVKIGERCAIYEGVHMLGWRAFREDRQAA